MQESQERAEYTLVARKPSFGLPTGCPICLPLFLYLKFSNFPFHSIWFSTTLSLIQVFFFGFLFSFIVIHVCKLLFWVSACFFFVAASLPCVCFLCFHFLLLCVDRSESLRKRTSFLQQSCFHRMDVNLIMLRWAVIIFSLTGFYAFV